MKKKYVNIEFVYALFWSFISWWPRFFFLVDAVEGDGGEEGLKDKRLEVPGQDYGHHQAIVPMRLGIANKLIIINLLFTSHVFD